MTTAYRQVLVHVDATRHLVHRLSVAREIAQECGAHLAALYAVTPMMLAQPLAAAADPAIAAEIDELDRSRRAGILREFDDAMKGPGPLASWAEVRPGAALESAFARQAMYADIMVLGQHDPDDPQAPSLPADFVASVLLASGRPGLVLPRCGWPRSIGLDVAIAWKDTPESARAVTAAIPLLQAARRVHVLAWGEPQAGEQPVQGQELNLTSYLRLHCINPVWHREAREPHDVGAAMLARSAELDADLLVMGCYGHGRAREWALGGATRTVLERMELPVLLAH